MRAVFQPLSPDGPRARLQILIFHRVLREPDPLFPGEMDAARFQRVCGWLRRWFNVLPLDAAVRRRANGTLPARAAAITFDDGYADNHDVALPILQRHGLAATFFIATGFLDGGRMWNDTLVEAVRGSPLEALTLDGVGCFALRDTASRQQALTALIQHAKYLPHSARLAFAGDVAQASQAALPRDLMLRSQQVQQLASGGMQIGAHTISHPILAQLSDADAEREMAESRETLQALLQAPVTLFAYPNGRPDTDYSARSVALARGLGFEAAVTTAWGAASAETDAFELPRFTPWDHGKLMFAQRLWRNLRSPEPARAR